MSKATILNGSIQLFSWIDHETAERVTSIAKLPTAMAQDWEGQSINLIDWKIAEDRQTVAVTYQTRNDAYAPILDAVLALVVERVKLTPPNRSKHWTLEQHSDRWFNRKTGERVYV